MHYIQYMKPGGNFGDKLKTGIKKFLKAAGEASKMAKDARINNPGAAMIRDAYAKGDEELAKLLTDEMQAANLTGIALGSGTAPLITGFTTAPVTTGATLATGMVGGMAGMYGTDKAINYFSDGKYTGWGNWINQATNGTIGENTASFFHPGAIFGGLTTGKIGNKIVGVTNRGKLELLNSALNKNILATTLQPTVVDEAVLRGQLGWAPKQTIPYRHGSKLADLKTFVPKHDRWDVVTHGADPNMYFVTDQSTPVSAANMMDRRVYQYTGNIMAEKPMVQIGEIKPAGVKNNSRNQLIARARQQGADAYIMQDIEDNQVPHLNIVARFIGPEGEAVQGGAASVKWYGPTMGKTTAAKVTPNLVDIDPLLKPIRAKHAKRLGLEIDDPKVSADPAYKQEVANFVLEWRVNPENRGKTLVASTKHLLDPQYKIEFANEPSIPDFETFAARNKARGFKETDEQLRAWYNSIFELGRDLNIDNRFVLDIEGLAPNSHLLGDDAVRMFKEYGGEPIPQGSINGVQILAYIPEVRQRYGLVGNPNITDDEIAQALYKHIKELGGNTAAVNGHGEPLLLFRGSTSRHDKLIPKGTSELLVSGADNILGNLFLGLMPYTVPGGDEGVGRYLGKMHGWMGPIPPLTKAAEVILPESKILAEDMYTLYTSKKFGDVKKLPGYAMSTGYNDINAFIVRTPSVRDATDEIVVLNPFETIPVDKRLGSTHSEHYRALIKDAELNNQGLIHSKPVLETRRNGTFGKYRDEHEYYDYFALPNFNIQNAKHILPYDFRIPRDWENPIIYRKQGGKLNYLNLMRK